MRWRSLPPAAALLLCLAAAARADDWDRYYGAKLEIDAGHSLVGFAVPFMGLTKTEGRFKDFSGTLMYDAEDPTRSAVSIAIRAESLDTANDQRDEDLRSAGFFDVAKHPLVTFRSTRVERRGGGYAAVGPLALHGVTREVAIPFALAPGGGKDAWGNVRIAFEGGFTIHRGDFGMAGNSRFAGLGEIAIGQDVDVRLSIQAVRWNVAVWDLDPRSIVRPLEATIAEKGIDAAVAQYRDLKQNRPEAYLFAERSLGVLGHRLLQARKTAEGVAIFRLNAEAYPGSASVWDELAAALAASGDRKGAAEACRKALAIEPFDTDALEILRRLEEDAAPGPRTR